MCAVLHQLFSLQPQLLRHALPFWERTHEKIQYDVEDVWHIFMTATSDPEAGNTICVFDGLDECRSREGRQLIEKLREFYDQRPANQKNWLKFLATGRPYTEFLESINFPNIDLGGGGERLCHEMAPATRKKMAELRERLGLDAELCKELEQILLKQCTSYLRLDLAIDFISKALEDNLELDHEKLRSTSLQEAYENILDLVASDNRLTVQAILRIIVAARRPLTIREMAMALGVAISPDAGTATKAGLDPEGLVEKIQKLCAFVSIRNAKIYLVHRTARDFLLCNDFSSVKFKWHFEASEIEAQMTEVCVRYLLMNDLVSDGGESVQSLLNYAAVNWPGHFRRISSPNPELVASIYQLYDPASKNFALWSAIFWKVEMPHDERIEIDALHLAAFNGHHDAIKRLLMDGKCAVNYQDSTGMNALQWASLRGHINSVQVLLEIGADINAHGGIFGSALQAASSQGHQEIVQLLIEKGADDTLHDGEHVREDSDAISDVSEVISVFSSSSTINSFSSAGSYGDARLTSAEHLAYILSKDSLLAQLYVQAIQKLGTNRFSKNHDQFLKKLLMNIRMESDDPLLLHTVRFLQKRSQREQVTTKICQLFQPESTLIRLSAMRQLQDQKEDREFRLNLLLKEQSEPRERENQEHRDDASTEDEESDENEDDNEDDEEGDQTRRFQHLESVVSFFSNSTSFEDFKSSLNYFINPPTSIDEALGSRDIKVLRQLLKKRFDLAARGDYSWIRELDDIGYTHEDIAELLFEQANDSPWIYFEPDTYDRMEARAGMHLPECVHQLFSFDPSPNNAPDTHTLSSFQMVDGHGITRLIQETCGLAGITPLSRDPSMWNGSVEFEERNSVALVSYSQPAYNNGQEYQSKLLMIRKAFEQFCSAAGCVQAAGLCCDSFTILRLSTSSPSQQNQAQSVVEMCRINFDLGLQILDEMKNLFDWNSSSFFDFSSIKRLIFKVISPFAQGHMETPLSNDIGNIIHYLSLAGQFMCLGFLSYSQAHVGPIQPFFLDTALEKIHLLGSQKSIGGSARIEASLSSLTCIGNMIRGPVVTFKLIQPLKVSRPMGKPQAYDILANAEDLLDTWGPGNFVMHEGTNKLPSAITLGNGIVWCSDPENNKFHWSRSAAQANLSYGGLDPRRKIIIGTFITVNDKCKIKERDCWASSSTSLEPLGPYGSSWEHDEKQYGLQAGNYVLLQANRGWHKLPGLTLKQHRLQQDDHTLISFLDNLWGVQVSFCTGVARRVPLYEMVADMLPVFSTVFTDQERLWKELNMTHHISDAFRCNNVREFLVKLSPELHQLVMKLVRRIFDVLQHTGLNREKTHLLVAWPDTRDIYRCFKVPCQKKSSWIPVLADSEDCATFAYISTTCFETETIKCSGRDVSWKNAILLLETAVIVHPRSTIPLTATLEHKSIYFFKKLDNLFFVEAQKPDTSGTAVLTTTTLLSDISPRFKQRIIEKFRAEERKQQSRLREKILAGDLAEQVVVTRMEAF